MNIIICGYGKMGRLIEKFANEYKWNILAVIEPTSDYKAKTLYGTPFYQSVESIAIDQSNSIITNCNIVAIDFTHPSCVLDNIAAFAKKKIPLVVGTTGWHDKLIDVKETVTNANSSLLWSSNFSLGVNIFYKIAALACALFNKYSEYDVAGFEIHHNQKADSPSGTAKEIEDIVLKNFTRKKKVIDEKLDRKPQTDELHFASMRCGSVPGTHSLLFDSTADSIEIKHTTRNREGLVMGALAAAKWLSEKTKSGESGIWTMEDVLK
ncbi:MAG: 4-hydroxy-tetrahydrodipicolinate reductase [Termitinemataceae bacterium]|nr:MAG: 4-hydroxy-tetrahydrodipicolinate reductase [Termitinemataceae bacterium]